MSVESTKAQNSSPSSAVTVSAPKNAAKASPAGGAGADGAGFTGLLDNFSNPPDPTPAAQSGLDAAAQDAGDDDPAKDAGARRKASRPGEPGEAAGAEAQTAADLLAQMALMAEAARQAAAAAQPAPAEGSTAAQGNTDPAVLAAALNAQKPAAALPQGPAAGASAQPTAASALSALGEGASTVAKGPRDVLAQLQAQLQALDKGRAGAEVDTSAALQTQAAKVETQFKDLAARALDAIPLGGVAEEVTQALSSLVEPEKNKSTAAAESRSGASEGNGWLATGDSQDRLQPLGVTAAGASDAGQQMADAQYRNPEDVVAEQVSYWINQKRQGAELTLDGGQGQPVAVSISMNGNEAHVVFRSDQAATREMLNGALPELKSLLQSEGLILSGVSVGAGQGQGQMGQSGRQAQGSDGNARRSGVGGVGGAGRAEAGPAGTVLRRSVNSNQALDLFV